MKKQWVIGLIVTLLVVSLFKPAWSQSNLSLENLTQKLTQLSQQQSLNTAQVKEAIALAKTRHDLLLKDIKTKSVKDFSQYLLPEKIVAKLPIQAQKFVEKEAVVEGELEIRIIDLPKSEETDYVVKTSNGKLLHIYFLKNPIKGFVTGDKVRLNGLVFATEASNRMLFLSKDLQIIQHVAVANSFGPQNTVAFLVNFQDQPANKPWTVDQMTATLNSVNNMYYEYSYNQTTVVGKVYGWFTLPVDSTTDCNTLTDDIVALTETAAIQAGIDLTPYKHRIFIFPKLPQCSWSGLGTVGTSSISYSKAWLNGTITPHTTGHELGHNLGLHHSKYLQCTNSPNQGTCTLITYGDNTDIMGGGTTGHFNAYQKDRLGWINYNVSPPILMVSKSGTYVIDSYEVKNQNYKALKILKAKLANGSSDYYYVEFRQPIGFDSDLTCRYCDYTKGVVIHQGNSVNTDTVQVLDMTPSDNSRKTIALLPGNTFSDPNTPLGNMTITTNSVSPSGATVTVTFANAVSH